MMALSDEELLAACECTAGDMTELQEALKARGFDAEAALMDPALQQLAGIFIALAIRLPAFRAALNDKRDGSAEEAAR